MTTVNTILSTPQPLIHPQNLPLVRVSGSPREMGRQVGETCSAQIQHSIENAQSLVAAAFDTLQLNWEGAQIQARKYMPFAQEKYPQYVEELVGISEGAGVSFYDLAVLNGMEAVTTDALHLQKCTSFAVNQERSANGHVMLAHNEDWLPDDEPDIYIVHATPDHEPPYLAMTYGGLLPNIGFNAHGIAQACDSVYPNDCRIGIPRLVASRAVLAAHTPADAIRDMLAAHRAAGYNHLLVHESGEMYNVEVSARKFAILYAHEGYLAHTNNYLDPAMQTVESEPDELVATRVRYFRTLRLMRQTPMHTLQSLQAIQKDHVNYQDSICNHAQDETLALDREKTITSLVMDLDERKMYATWGNPCESEYFEYQLDC